MADSNSEPAERALTILKATPFAVGAEAFADDCGIPLKARHPQLVTEHDHRLGTGRIVGRCEDATEPWRDTQHFEKACGGDLGQHRLAIIESEAGVTHTL